MSPSTISNLEYELLWLTFLQSSISSTRYLKSLQTSTLEVPMSAAAPLNIEASGNIVGSRSLTTELLTDAITYMASHGLITFPSPSPRLSQTTPTSPSPGGTIAFISATPFPTPFPRTCYNDGLMLAPTFNTLADALSCDWVWMLNELHAIGKTDLFVHNILDIIQRVYTPHHGGRTLSNDIRCMLVRSDYMTDVLFDKQNETNYFQLKQIELNTTSVSCGSFACNLSEWHKLVVNNVLSAMSTSYAATAMNEKNTLLESWCPTNQELTKFSNTIKLCCDTYGKRYGHIHQPIVLWVVADVEKGEVDHRHLHFNIEGRHHLKSIKASLNELIRMRSVGDFYALPADVEEDGRQEPCDILKSPSRLFIRQHLFDGKYVNYEITVIYYRYCYAPDHFECTSHWELLECLEWSNAVKIPSLPSLLAGTKKMQQRWCDENVLNRFICNPVDRTALQKCFALQVDPQDVAARRIVELAIESPQDYVLKPQREGGGNNLHGGELREQLMKELIASNEVALMDESYDMPTSSYVLMEKIKPPIYHITRLSTSGVSSHSGIEIQPLETVSEFSVYGCFVADGKEVLINEEAGTLLRTKASDKLEGGFYSGVSAIDSVFLCDNSSLQTFIKLQKQQ